MRDHLHNDKKKGGNAHDHFHFPPNVSQTQHRSSAELGAAILSIIWILGLEPVQDTYEDTDSCHWQENKPPTFPSKDSGAACMKTIAVLQEISDRELQVIVLTVLGNATVSQPLVILAKLTSQTHQPCCKPVLVQYVTHLTALTDQLYSDPRCNGMQAWLLSACYMMYVFYQGWLRTKTQTCRPRIL